MILMYDTKKERRFTCSWEMGFVIAILHVVVFLSTNVDLTDGLRCYECAFDYFNRTQGEGTDCLHVSSLTPKSNCEMMANEDANDDGNKINELGNWSSIETFNFDINIIPPRPVCYLELSMLNGEIIQLVRSCRLSSEPSTCEFLERKGNAQKAKNVICYCQENGCNFPTRIEQLSIMYNMISKTSSGFKKSLLKVLSIVCTLLVLKFSFSHY